jgi:hypothetical protein
LRTRRDHLRLSVTGRHEQHERHAADQHRLRHEIEPVEDEAEKAEQVEQRSQGVTTLSRTEKLTSPRVMCPSTDSTCQLSFQRPAMVACTRPASTFGGAVGTSTTVASAPSGRCRLNRERCPSMRVLNSSLTSSSPGPTIEFMAGRAATITACAPALPQTTPNATAIATVVAQGILRDADFRLVRRRATVDDSGMRRQGSSMRSVAACTEREWSPPRR